MKAKITEPVVSKDDRQCLEGAIDTLMSFADQSAPTPTLEHLHLTNGTLELRELSSLEKTLSCLMESVFHTKREKRKKQRKPIKAKLLDSIDIIKIALYKLQHGEEVDQELHDRLLKVVHRYNAIVKCAKTPPKTLSEKIKRFFF